VKILLVSSQFPPAKTGYARIASELYHRFVERGEDVDLVTEGRGCRRTWGSIGVLTGEGRRLLDRGADIVQIIGPTPRFTEQCARHAARRGLKVVYTVNALPGLSSNQSGAHRRAVDFLYDRLVFRPTLRRADVLVFNTRDHAASLAPESSRPVEIIPYGINAGACSHVCRAASSGQAAGGSKEDPERGRLPTVLFVGQFRRYKGVSYLVEAARLLRDQGVDIALRLVGSGPELGNLTRQIQSAGLVDQTTIEDGIDDETLHIRYATSDLLVLPSLGAESFGIVLVEARAHGLPLVATDIPGVREVTRTLGGRIVPPGHPTALAQAIAQTIRELQAAGPSYRQAAVPEEFTWSRVAERYLHLYDRILRSRSTREASVARNAPSREGPPAVSAEPRIAEPHSGTAVPGLAL
jgi:glycosyltransferase involved in cell wall biosynthesis